jgi:hypothetical protein
MARKSKPETKKVAKARRYYASEPWVCDRTAGGWVISAFVEATGKREPVAQILPVRGSSSEALGGYIAKIVSEAHAEPAALSAALAALEAVAEEGWTWATECEVDKAIETIKARNC